MPELAVLFAAASLGAMLFFSIFIAPTVFRVLTEEDGGRLLRAVFPKYFMANGVLALAAGLAAVRPLESTIFALCGAAMLAIRFFAIPTINAARDAMVAGDAQAAERFARWHRGTVVVNVIEMLALTVAISLLLTST
ncbi:MAG: DUF4149 domain-containing protein [Pseudomonadota bacterium]